MEASPCSPGTATKGEVASPIKKANYSAEEAKRERRPTAPPQRQPPAPPEQGTRAACATAVAPPTLSPLAQAQEIHPSRRRGAAAKHKRHPRGSHRRRRPTRPKKSKKSTPLASQENTPLALPLPPPSRPRCRRERAARRRARPSHWRDAAPSPHSVHGHLPARPRQTGPKKSKKSTPLASPSPPPSRPRCAEQRRPEPAAAISVFSPFDQKQMN